MDIVDLEWWWNCGLSSLVLVLHQFLPTGLNGDSYPTFRLILHITWVSG